MGSYSISVLKRERFMFLKKILLSKIFSNIADFFREFPEGDLSFGTVFWCGRVWGLRSRPNVLMEIPPCISLHMYLIHVAVFFLRDYSVAFRI